MTSLAPSTSPTASILKGRRVLPFSLTGPIVLAILVIGGLALGLRLATYNRYLPFIDYTDEAVYVALGHEIRGLSDETALRQTYGSLPPLYSYFNALVQTGYDAVKPHSWTLMSDYYYVLRFLAVWMGMFTALGMTWLGWQIGGPIAGWIAGLIWATHPTIVELNSLAIPDPPLYLCMVLATCAGLYAWKHDSKMALLWALIAGIVGTYLKYWVVTVTFPFLAAWLVLFRRNPREMTMWTLVYVVIAGVSAAVLVFGINPLETNNTLNKYETSSLLDRMFDVQRLTNNFWHAAYPVGVPLYVGGLIAGGLASLYSRSRQWRLVEGRFVLLLIVMSTVGFFLTAAISYVGLSDAGRMRHILPTMTVMFVLWGVALAQFLYTLGDVLTAHRVFKGDRAALQAAALGVLFIVLAIPYGPANIEAIIRFNKEHIVNRVRDWSDIAIPNEGLVLQPLSQSDLDRVWNRTWGAYAGDNPLLYWSESQSQILESTPQDYAERNIDYLVIGEADLMGSNYNDPAFRDWLNQLYLLKTFPQSDDAGSTTYFYKMLSPQARPEITFGDIIILDGYDLSSTDLAAGETLTFRPYWRIEQIPPTNYSMFVHLYPADTLDMKAQQDGALVNRDRQTQQWNDVDEVYIGRDTVLTLPSDLPAGDYRLAIGVYDYVTFQRLTLPDDTDFYSIPITIEEK